MAHCTRTRVVRPVVVRVRGVRCVGVVAAVANGCVVVVVARMASCAMTVAGASHGADRGDALRPPGLGRKLASWR